MEGHRGAATRLSAALCTVLGVTELPIRLVVWDGSAAGPADAPRMVLRSRRALRRLLWAPGELGLGRAYVSGDLEIDGDIYALLGALQSTPRLTEPTPLRLSQRGRLLVTAARLGAVGPNPAPPPEEVRLVGRQHDQRRDR
ncbi:MAG: SAM-dependent methyltransferase, partial [Actinomycetota bacterium]|nr:SAM-dependent methyltransferase [Actinomycetota bacterium]